MRSAEAGHIQSLIGPRDFGLASPAVQTVRSLMQATSAIVGLGTAYGAYDTDELKDAMALATLAERTISTLASVEWESSDGAGPRNRCL